MRLQAKYKKIIIPKLMTEFKYKNELAVPKLKKAVINVGFGRQAKDKNFVDNVVSALARISGQKPVLAKAKKSISAFKVRQGMVIGAYLTLRGNRMFDFVDKLINISFPRIRDFRGLDKQTVDRNGNMTIGFKEHLAFPEIKADEVENIFGLEISLATTAENKEAGLRLFELLGFPFKKSA